MSNQLERYHRKESLLLYGSAFVLVLIGFIVAYQFVEPAPPQQIRIATGSADNAYYRFAQQYRTDLQRQGIGLEVVETAGSIENLQLLTDGRVDIAFVQGGISARPAGLQSLASLYFEPLWVFYRKDIEANHLSDLKHRRIAIGAQGSGTRAIAQQLLTDNGIDENNSTLLSQAGNDSLDALKQGTLDALMTVTGPHSLLVQQLLNDPDIALLHFSRAEAYKRRHRFLSDVVLPAGVSDLAANIPANDITLLAPAATLVVRADFHPALASLMLEAATTSHSTGGLFEQTGEFPSSRYLDYPLNADAKRFLRSGPPFLQRYLPFWAANLVDRLIVMLVPLITLMIPLAKILPPTYRWRVRSKIYRWYDQLRSLDFRAEEVQTKQQAQQLLEELLDIEKDVMQVVVPKSYADTQYNLRVHLRLIRERLERQLVCLSQ